ncbi:MAG: PDZ domain-containing protein [Planctomycetes bacterium]|nr:PDZ domain-containing protein [Planctomycetota bacterium]
MKRILGIISVSVLAALAGLAAVDPIAGRSARAQSAAPAPAAQPDQAAPAAQTQKTMEEPKKPAAESKPASEDAESVKATERLMKAARQSFVIVQTWYKKDWTETVTDRDQPEKLIYSEYVDKKRPDQAAGVVVDKSLVLITDDGVEDRFIDRISVKDSAGREYPAKRERLLFKTPGLLLKVADEEKLVPVKSATGIDLPTVTIKEIETTVSIPDGGTLLLGGSGRGRASEVEREMSVPTTQKADGPKTETKPSRLAAARFYKSDEQWQIDIRPYYPSYSYSQSDDADDLFFGYLSSVRQYRYRTSQTWLPIIIADDDGNPIGCSPSSLFDSKQNFCAWRFGQILQDKGLTWSQYADLEKTGRQAVMKCVYEVIIKLRQSDQGPDDEGSRRSSGGAAGREATLFGLAVSPTDILVPATGVEINSTNIKSIETFYLKSSAPGSRNRTPLNFAGAYKNFSAILLRIPAGKLPSHLALAGQDPPRMKPLWAAAVRKKGGENYVDLAIGRVIAKTEGYEGKSHWYVDREMQPGSLLIDFDGKLAGIYVRQRIDREDELIRQAASYGGISPIYRLFTAGELAEPLGKPAKFIDPAIAVVSKTQARRRAWFGVEFVSMSRDLAEEFKVEQPTQDGKIGFLVNAVYTGSPAEKSGIRVGDIMLNVMGPGMEQPMNLFSEAATEDQYDRREYYGRNQGEDNFGPLAPSWKNRVNYLTRAFDAVGIGKKVKIACIRPDGEGKDKSLTVDYTIQQAPVDQDSAPKWQNRKLGLTVKDMTYEVRYALSLKADDPGVIVAKVERGSAVETARIFQNEVILRMDDKPLASARQMQDLIAKARDSGVAKVQLTVLRLGKTRFADLAIKDYDPAEDEGLDEDDQPATKPGK